jgi:hypothetical protein
LKDTSVLSAISWEKKRCLNSSGSIKALFSLLSLLKKIKLSLWDQLAVCCVSVYLPTNIWLSLTIFMKFGMYIMAPEPISTTYKCCRNLCEFKISRYKTY